jgi:hypothetical protein
MVKLSVMEPARTGGGADALLGHEISAAGPITEAPSLRTKKFVADTSCKLVIENNNAI